MLKLDYAVASDRGLVRSNNEDSAYAGPYLPTAWAATQPARSPRS